MRKAYMNARRFTVRVDSFPRHEQVEFPMMAPTFEFFKEPDLVERARSRIGESLQMIAPKDEPDLVQNQLRLVDPVYGQDVRSCPQQVNRDLAWSGELGFRNTRRRDDLVSARKGSLMHEPTDFSC